LLTYLYFIVIQLDKDGGPQKPHTFQHSTPRQPHKIKYVVQVSSCSTCGRKSLHEGLGYISRCGKRDGLLMSFEDGSVVHRAATWTDTAAKQGSQLWGN